MVLLANDTKGCRRIILICMVVIIVVVGIPTFFIVGGIYTGWYGIRGLTYEKTVCLVHSTFEYSDQCKTRISKYASRIYTCYGAMWIVHHGENKTIAADIKDAKRFNSRSDAINKANTYRINSTYVCWYNPRKPVEAEWNQSPIVGFILLICGTALTLILLMVVGYFYLRRK